LMLAALLLWRVVGLALAPLGRMAALADRIRDGARGRRLRPTRPSTEIGRTAAAIDSMLDSLEAAEADAQVAEERMRRFLADASHDLRTPMAAVITTAEHVLRANPGRQDREHQLVTVIREAQRAARLVDDLLLMARLDDPTETTSARPAGQLHAGPSEWDEVDVAEVAHIAAGRTAEPIVVDETGPARAAADPDAVHRILSNLIDNAARVNPPGAAVRISVSRAAGQVILDVSDRGPGITPAERDRVFDRFVRLTDAADGRPAGGGHGLGLPIARGLARRHGGDLDYVERPAGATFRLTLPAAPDRETVPLVAAVQNGREW
jgi:two-component system, OmpR family, sensor kinase